MSDEQPTREFRTTPLARDEAEADEAVRRAVMAEFPPTACGRGLALTTVLRRALSAGVSIDEVARRCRVLPTLLSEFAAGRRDLHLAIAERLAEALGVSVEVTAGGMDC